MHIFTFHHYAAMLRSIEQKHPFSGAAPQYTLNYTTAGSHQYKHWQKQEPSSTVISTRRESRGQRCVRVCVCEECYESEPYFLVMCQQQASSSTGLMTSHLQGLSTPHQYTVEQYIFIIYHIILLLCLGFLTMAWHTFDIVYEDHDNYIEQVRFEMGDWVCDKLRYLF